ncbi:PIG-U-domain-containing protein [Atractiella rhizophila]|nr:PIG-U-domain-containing protein [Atractiella rhizophila]
MDLSHRVELTTPLHSIHSLREAIYLYQHGIDPYSSTIVHHPPLLIPLYSAIPAPLLSLALHAASSALLYKTNKVAGWTYALNPVNLLATASLSSEAFGTLPVIIALTSALRGDAAAAGAAVALAGYMDVYSFLLSVPCYALLLHSLPSSTSSSSPSVKKTARNQFLLFLIGNFVALNVLSYALVGSFSYIFGTWGCQLTTCTLTPTIGLNWYFFTEQFDHFRTLFLFLFALHLISYPLPLTIRYSTQPLLAFLLTWSLLALFSPYPTLYTFSVPLALLPTLQSHLIPHLPPLWHAAAALMAAYALLPAFYDAWLDGRGNANFFYAATLVYALGGVLVVTGWAKGGRRWEWEVRGEGKRLDGEKEEQRKRWLVLE